MTSMLIHNEYTNVSDIGVDIRLPRYPGYLHFAQFQLIPVVGVPFVESHDPADGGGGTIHYHPLVLQRWPLVETTDTGQRGIRIPHNYVDVFESFNL